MKKFYLFFLFFIPAVILFASPETDLIKAVENGKSEQVLSALKKGASPDTLNQEGDPVLFIAIDRLYPKIVKILVDNGADIHIKDSKNRNVIKMIIIKQADIQLDSLESDDAELKEKTAKIKEIKTILDNAEEKYLASKPDWALIHFSEVCDLDGIKSALKNNAQINYQNKEGDSALIAVMKTISIQLGFKFDDLDPSKGVVQPFEAADFLLKKGIDPKLKNNKGKTALHYAVKNMDIKTIKLLLSKGAAVNEADNEGITPLMASVYNFNSEIAGFLLKSGADPLLKDKSGKTALDWAVLLQKEFAPPKADPFDQSGGKQKMNPYDDVVQTLKKATKK